MFAPGATAEAHSRSRSGLADVVVAVLRRVAGAGHEHVGDAVGEVERAEVGADVAVRVGGLPDDGDGHAGAVVAGVEERLGVVERREVARTEPGGVLDRQVGAQGERRAERMRLIGWKSCRPRMPRTALSSSAGMAGAVASAKCVFPPTR